MLYAQKYTLENKDGVWIATPKQNLVAKWKAEVQLQLDQQQYTSNLEKKMHRRRIMFAWLIFKAVCATGKISLSLNPLPKLKQTNEQTPQKI